MLKTIATFSSEIDAEVFKGVLSSSGIQSFIFKDDCGGMRPHMQLTDGVQVKVAHTDFEAAENLIRAMETTEDKSPINEIEKFKHIQHLLQRSKGWILVGFTLVPGCIAFPLSFIYANKASKIFKKRRFYDNRLKNKIMRMRTTSALCSILFWAVIPVILIY